MRKVKFISWLSFLLLYIYIIILVTMVVYATKAETDSLIIKTFVIIGAILAVIILVLGVVNLILCIKLKNEIQNSKIFLLVLKIKLLFIPFFIINFSFWLIFWLGTLNPFLILTAPIIWLISLLTTYIFMLIFSMPNVIYLGTNFAKTKKLRYLVYIAFHFIYFLDIVGAYLTFREKTNLAYV